MLQILILISRKTFQHNKLQCMSATLSVLLIWSVQNCVSPFKFLELTNFKGTNVRNTWNELCLFSKYFKILQLTICLCFVQKLYLITLWLQARMLSPVLNKIQMILHVCPKNFWISVLYLLNRKVVLPSGCFSCFF